MVVPVFVKRGGLMPFDWRYAFREHRSKSNGPLATILTAWGPSGLVLPHVHKHLWAVYAQSGTSTWAQTG